MSFWYYLAQEPLTFSHFIAVFQTKLNLPLKTLFLFLFIFFECISLNTTCSLLPCLQNKMKQKYGVKILVERGYNSPLRTAIRSSALLGVFGLAIKGAETVRINEISSEVQKYELHQKSYETQVKAVMDHNSAEARKVHGTNQRPNYQQIPTSKQPTAAEAEATFTIGEKVSGSFTWIFGSKK